jgi:hypothetical protein
MGISKDRWNNCQNKNDKPIIYNTLHTLELGWNPGVKSCDSGWVSSSCSTCNTLGFFVESVLVIFLIVLLYYVSVRSESCVAMSVTISAYIQYSVRLYSLLPGVYMRAIVFVCDIGVSNTYYVVFLFVFVFYGVFILCRVYIMFLWIVYFWLPLWYSLTFIRYLHVYK